MDFSGVRLHGYYEWPFEQIAAVIEEAIRSGELRPHDPLPTEKDLQDLTGASRGTVRHAMALLREKGLIYTRPQLGSFVAPQPDLRRQQPPHLCPYFIRGADEHPHSRSRIPCFDHAGQEGMRSYLAAQLGGKFSGAHRSA